jgi:hypothetical protein
MSWSRQCAIASLAAVSLLTLAVVPTRANAQSYRFAVPRLHMQVFVQPDASIRVTYDITFLPRAGAHAIDIVDIGMPHAGYDIGTMRASVDGHALRTVRESQYVDPGVEVHLGGRAIRGGREGTLHFEFAMPDMVYQDTTREDYASLRITPTWFDSEFVVDSGEIRVAVHVPAGVEPGEVVHQGTPFSDKAIFQDRVVAVWTWQGVRAVQPYMVGLSFPRRGMHRVIEQSAWDLLVKWFEERLPARVVVFVLTVMLLACAFFRFTGGTGISVFVVLLVGMFFGLRASTGALLISPLVAGALVVLAERQVRRRRARYLPAVAEVEGGGVKRGLTAPEAAVILELPLSKVLGLVIFALLKKGVLRQVQATPLRVEMDDAFRGGPDVQGDVQGAATRASVRRLAAQQRGVALHKYEQAFLDHLEDNVGGPVHAVDFAGPVKGLIEHAAARMKGFDLSDTRDYYRRVVARALDTARSVTDVPAREQTLDRQLEWILMGDDYDDVFRHGDYRYRPRWGRASASTGPTGSAGALGRTAPGAETSFGDVAASFAGWAENTMGDMASAIAPSALQLEAPPGGVIDLSGADQVTGEFFKALTESSGSGGGHGGGGCACAGCACACACAGGGR